MNTAWLFPIAAFIIFATALSVMVVQKAEVVKYEICVKYHSPKECK